MVTTLTASRPSRRGAALAAFVLALIFLVTQATALSHEMEHVLHQHDAQCVLHLAVEHLVMVAAPEPEPVVAPAPVILAAFPLLLAPPVRPAHPRAARAPPLLP